jgi:hypothetical protein
MHPLGVVVVLPERAGAAVGTVGKTTVDATCWVGAGVTQRGHLPWRFCLGLRFAARTKDSVVLRLVGSGTDGAQLGLEWAHWGMSMTALLLCSQAHGVRTLLSSSWLTKLCLS